MTEVDDNSLRVQVTDKTLILADATVNMVLVGATAPCTSNSGKTDYTCTFEAGIPATEGDASPVLVYSWPDSEDFTHNSITSEVVNKSAGTPAGISGLSCSFEGGCLYEISG